VPALRERPEDIAELATHLLATSEVGEREIAPCALAALRRQAWPGNVREPRNVLVQAALGARGALREQHVIEVLRAREEAGRKKLDPAEARRIFEEVGFNVSAAARRADLPRSTMRDLLLAAGAPLGVRKARPAPARDEPSAVLALTCVR
jgi:DNA-binding NtrC family response regulator